MHLSRQDGRPRWKRRPSLAAVGICVGPALALVHHGRELSPAIQRTQRISSGGGVPRLAPVAFSAAWGTGGLCWEGYFVAVWFPRGALRRDSFHRVFSAQPWPLQGGRVWSTRAREESTLASIWVPGAKRFSARE